MKTERYNRHRLGYTILLIGLLSLIFAGQRIGFAAASLRSLAQPATTVAQPLVAAAGPPSLLLLNAEALVLTMNGDTTTLTARVRDEIGRPVPGVSVQFQSELGRVTPAKVTTDAAGLANTIFTAGGTPGQAVVTAAVNGLAQQSAIQIVKPNSDATTHKLVLEFSPGKLEHGQQANFSAVLSDASGQPVAGELVSFFGSLGEVTPASAMSDASGRVTATYRAGSAPGQAKLTALAGYASRSVAFQVGELPAPPDTSDKIFLPMVTR
jgi:hypothetical protein